MSSSRRSLILVATVLAALVLVLWSCSGSDPDGDGDGSTDGSPATSTTDPAGGDPPPIVPVTGGTDESGQPEPPPIHAVFSVVVRGDTSWEPYAGPELNGLDLEAAQAVGARLRQLDAVLRQGGITASIELAYGPAAALCEVDPGLLDALEASGHRIGLHARSTGEAFRAQTALGRCGRVATTASGLGAMADPHGPDLPTLGTLTDALAVLSVLDLHQVVGRVSPLCTDLGLAEPTHGYGTGAFTAPWRSGWTVDQPCSDLARGRIVVIDQNLLVPAEGAVRLDPTAWSTLRARSEQVLAYALDLRFAEAGDLPAPGIITWGVSVRLDDLIAPDPVADDTDDTDDGDGGDGGDGGSEGEDGEGGPATEPVVPVDPRTAPLGEEALAELALVIEERWGPSMESGRLRWMLPDELALMMRPLNPPQ